MVALKCKSHNNKNKGTLLSISTCTIQYLYQYYIVLKSSTMGPQQCSIIPAFSSFFKKETNWIWFWNLNKILIIFLFTFFFTVWIIIRVSIHLPSNIYLLKALEGMVMDQFHSVVSLVIDLLQFTCWRDRVVLFSLLHHSLTLKYHSVAPPGDCHHMFSLVTLCTRLQI